MAIRNSKGAGGRQPSWVILLLAVAACMLAPAVTFAQSGIAGVVKDTSGAVLPGVTVEAASPALIEKVRTVITDGQGQYKIVDLRPGVYSVTFTLPGFSTVKREGLELPASFTATVNADMKVGGLEETVTVSGEAPMVDVQNVAQSNLLSKAILESVPAASRVPQSYTVFLPGVTGGNSAGLNNTPGNSNLAIHGSLPGEHNVAIDGFTDRNMTQAGGSGFYYNVNQATVQEVAVQTGAGGAEQQTSGIMTNVIPKDGGNTFSGQAFFSYTDKHLVGDNVTDALRAQGVVSSSSIRKQWDVNPGVGGPIKKDRLWFFASYRHTGTEADGGILYNATPKGWIYTPDTGRPTASEKNEDRSNYLRLIWQASSKNKFAAFFDRQPRYWYNKGVTGTVSPEATTWTPYDPQYLAQVTWKSPVSNRFLLEAGTAYLNTVFVQYPNDHELIGENAFWDLNEVSALETSTNLRYRSASVYGSQLGDSKSLRSKFAASYVTGSHNFKTGLDYFTGDRTVSYYANGDYNVSLRNGSPTSVTLWAPVLAKHHLKADLGLYAQDQWTVSRLTLNMGVRFDYFNAIAEASDVPANRFVPAAHFDEAQGPLWRDLAPRVGASYDLFGNGKTALKATLGRYVFGQTLGGPGGPGPAIYHPIARSVLSATRTWNDNMFGAGDPRSGNFVPDCDFNITALNGECGTLSDLNFGKANPRAVQYDINTQDGYGKRPYNWEASASVQHELFRGVSVNGGYFRRWYGNFLAQDNLLVTPADFDPYCLTLPTDSRLPGGGTPLCGFYDVKLAKFGQNQGFVTFASTYGNQIQHFNGFDVTVSARLPGGGQFTAGSSTGRMEINSCYVVDSPTTPAVPAVSSANNLTPAGSTTTLQNANFCDYKTPFQTNLKFLGAYPLPWWGLQVSAAFLSVPGPEYSQTTYVATNAEIAPTLNRNLAAGATATVTLPIMKPGTAYADPTRKLDLRFTKLIRIGRTRVQGSLDVFNILNSSAVQSLITAYGPQWLKPTRILGPRMFNLSAQLDF